MTESSGSADLLLPSDACLVHVGPYKTGSSAIQFALTNARDKLAEFGTAYPGGGTRAKRPGWGVLGSSPRGWEPGTTSDWDTLVAEVHALPDRRVCVSTEDFARANPEQARRIVDDLGADRVHVVAVSRRLDRLLPSAWQQRVQSFETASYEEFLRAVLSPDPDHRLHRSFWASHDVAGMIERWTSVVGAGRFTLIVTPDGDRDHLPRSFERLLGLPAGTLQLDPKTNPSLSMNSTALVLQINRAFGDSEIPDEVYHQLVRRRATPAMKYAARTDSDLPIPRLPRWAAERVAELSEGRIRDVKATGVRVIGDVEQLRTPVPDDAPDGIADPDMVSLDSARRAVWAVIEGAVDLRAREQKQQRQEPAGLPPRSARPARPPGRLVKETSSRDLLRVIRTRAVARLSRSRRRS